MDVEKVRINCELKAGRYVWHKGETLAMPDIPSAIMNEVRAGADTVTVLERTKPVEPPPPVVSVEPVAPVNTVDPEPKLNSEPKVAPVAEKEALTPLSTDTTKWKPLAMSLRFLSADKIHDWIEKNKEELEGAPKWLLGRVDAKRRKAKVPDK